MSAVIKTEGQHVHLEFSSFLYVVCFSQIENSEKNIIHQTRDFLVYLLGFSKILCSLLLY